MALLDHIAPPRRTLLRLLLLPVLLLLLPPSVALLPPLAGRRPGWNSRVAKPGGRDTCRIVMLCSSDDVYNTCRPQHLNMRGSLCQRLEMHCVVVNGSFSSSVLKLQKFERNVGRIHVLWAMRLLPQWRLLPSTFRVPFFVTEADFPLANMSIFDPIIILMQPKMEEYKAIVEYAVKRATTDVRSIVFLIDPNFLPFVAQAARDKVAIHEPVIETENHVFDVSLKERFKNYPVLFVALSYVNNTQAYLFLRSLIDSRKGKTYVFLPYLVFQDLVVSTESLSLNASATDGKNLINLLNEVDTYVSKSGSANFATHRQKKRLIDSAMRLWIQDILKICEMGNPRRIAACLNNDAPFDKRKLQAWRKTARSIDFKKISSTGIKNLNDAVGLSLFSYNGIYKQKQFYKLLPRATNIQELFSTEDQMIARKHRSGYKWFNLVDRYRVVMNLEAPLVMIRNKTSPDDCEYGQDCRLDHSVKSLCCFGIGVDIARYIQNLDTLGNNQHGKACERVPQLKMEIDVVSPGTVWPDRKNRVQVRRTTRIQRNNATDFKDALQQYFTSGDYGMAIGSHVIVSSDHLNMSFVTKPYFSSPIGILISRKEHFTSYRVLSSFAAPFHWTMWLCVFVTVNATAVTCVICEWHSPYGLTPAGRNREKVFSFPSALNLCWSVLFSHTVASKSPKCWSSRFITNVYASFCIIFFASYTGNLTAYMSGRKLLYEISGVHDPQLLSGSIRVATVYGSGTHFHLSRAQPEIFKFAQLVDTVEEGFDRIKNREIDAFIYDIETLNYFRRVYHKDDFEIVGKPFAQVSYAVAISHKFRTEGSKIRDCISSLVSDPKYMKTMTDEKVWIREVPGVLVQTQRSNFSIETQNFLGPLLLFLGGILTGVVALCAEFIVFYTVVPWLRRSLKDKRRLLPFTQRLFRQMFTVPDYNKYAFSERNLPKAAPPVAERLSNYRRPSTTYPVDISRLLCAVTGRGVSATKSCPALSHLPNSVKVPEEEPDECLEAKEDSSTALLSHNSFGTLHVRTNAFAISPVTIYDSAESKQVNNMAVQTEIEAWVEHRLAPVDANIVARTAEFERDMRHMRSEVAKLMREKERLLRRLQRYENKTRVELELELSQERARTEERYMRPFPGRQVGLPPISGLPPPYLTVKNNLNV